MVAMPIYLQSMHVSRFNNFTFSTFIIYSYGGVNCFKFEIFEKIIKDYKTHFSLSRTVSVIDEKLPSRSGFYLIKWL